MRDIGIDLGTANILVFVRGKGIIIREPSVVAVDRATGHIMAAGGEAKDMIGRTPSNIIAIRPIKDGVIADFDYTQHMLKYFIFKAVKGKKLFSKTRVVVCIPSGVTPVEERAVREAALSAGANEAYLIEEPMAAAIGAGLPVHEPVGNMIVDIGGGTTEVAVISLGGIVTLASIRCAGDEMDSSIVSHIRRTYNLHIGDRTAEAIKMELGNAMLDEEYRSKSMEIRGRDTITGLPNTITVTAKEINRALEDQVKNIVDAIKTCLEKTPPELSADIIDRGIIFAGGGSLLHNLPQLVAQETGIPTHLAEDPLSAVANGTGKVLENLDAAKKYLVPSRRWK